ncbi:uncharacterized protein LOC111594113 [Drosophila hydei]|uniref:Uncharacterized protein LOC111594113 n=1 Tax=Drosophila hydei TaxID=7224 RepID=A0A6J1LCP6_DROHY|nr:uncharacterized protein LOC111594113 [Drosophila hydei]
MPRHRRRRWRRTTDLPSDVNGGLVKTLEVVADGPLTFKFYARHDWPYFNCSDEKLQEMREKHRRDLLPEANSNVVAKPSAISVSPPAARHVRTRPMTENQMYGWYQQRL